MRNPLSLNKLLLAANLTPFKLHKNLQAQIPQELKTLQTQDKISTGMNQRPGPSSQAYLERLSLKHLKKRPGFIFLSPMTYNRKISGYNSSSSKITLTATSSGTTTKEYTVPSDPAGSSVTVVNSDGTKTTYTAGQTVPPETYVGTGSQVNIIYPYQN